MLFTQSLLQGVLSSAWKIATVVAFYKDKGNKITLSSYRPISLTNIARKILERIKVSSLTSYLQDNKLLNKAQHRFQRRKSATRTFLNVIPTSPTS